MDENCQPYDPAALLLGNNSGTYEIRGYEGLNVGLHLLAQKKISHVFVGIRTSDNPARESLYVLRYHISLMHFVLTLKLTTVLKVLPQSMNLIFIKCIF
jgi:hypothetical protein